MTGLLNYFSRWRRSPASDRESSCMSDAGPSREELAERVAQLEAENAALREIVEQLRTRIVELERIISRNSGNSSLPPSRDDAHTRAALTDRRKAKKDNKARRPGKQPGDPGAHLAQVADPDHSVGHPPEHCEE